MLQPPTQVARQVNSIIAVKQSWPVPFVQEFRHKLVADKRHEVSIAKSSILELGQLQALVCHVWHLDIFNQLYWLAVILLILFYHVLIFALLHSFLSTYLDKSLLLKDLLLLLLFNVFQQLWVLVNWQVVQSLDALVLVFKLLFFQLNLLLELNKHFVLNWEGCGFIFFFASFV